MKKILVALMAFIYLGVSSGIAMEVHYCMGKKAGVEFYGGSKDKCSRCGMKEKKSGCCNEEHKFYKLNDAHKNVSNEVSFDTPVAIYRSIYSFYSFEAITYPSSTTLQNHSPPIYTKPSACVLHCNFRI